MPWAPRPADLRRLRLKRKWKPENLAAELGLTDRWVRLVEGEKHPATLQDKNVEALCDLYSCKPEAFADWVDYPGQAKAAPEIESPPSPAAIANARLAPVAPKSKPSASVLPKLGKLSERAKAERLLGLSDQSVTVPSGKYELLGLDKFKLCWSRPKAFDGRRFVVQGQPDDYMGLNPAAASALGADDGGKFRVYRMVADSLPFYATVFAASGAHFDALRGYLDRGAVSLVVRVVYKPAHGKWRGFFFYEDADGISGGKSATRIPKEFAFVVEEIYPAAQPGRQHAA
jgi:DNA-binding Xre family transcriptional regulator